MSVARIIALAFLVFSLGCDASATGDDAGASRFDAGDTPPSVELGQGTSGFEALPDTGGELELIGGPQGGFHVFLTARLRGLDPEGMRLTFSAIDTATGSNIGTPAVFNLTTSRVQRDGAGFVRAGDFLILNDMSADGLEGLTLDVTVLAEEAGGRSATDHRVVLIVDNVSG